MESKEPEPTKIKRKRARPLTWDEFSDWKNQDFWHLSEKVKRIDKLVWIILGSIIAVFIANLFLG